MINMVYLVLVFISGNGTGGYSTASEKIPQANMAQCQVNAREYKKDGSILKAYCIVGVMPK